jgi:hypothetical protein
MTIINLNSTIKTKDFDGVINETIWSLSVFKGDLIDVMTTEGRSDDYKCEIHLNNFFTGRTYALNHAFIGKIEYFEMIDEETGQDFSEYGYVRSETLAERVIEKIKAKGQVDLSLWVDVTE